MAFLCCFHIILKLFHWCDYTKFSLYTFIVIEINPIIGFDQIIPEQYQLQYAEALLEILNSGKPEDEIIKSIKELVDKYK